MKPRFDIGMPDDEYHADQEHDVPTLSQSTAHVLLSKSPRHAWWTHPRLGKHRSTETDAMATGTLMHRLLLGAGPDLEILDFKDFRTNAAKEARDNAKSAGRLPILKSKYDPLIERVDQIRDRLLTEHRLDFTDGHPEVSIYWDEETSSGVSVRCRGRLDFVVSSSPRVLDLKFVASAAPGVLSKKIHDFGHDIQAAAYTRGAETVWERLAGRMEFVFVFIEAEPPHGITLAKLDPDFFAMGGKKWQRAVDVWERCLRENDWPDYCSASLGVPSIIEPPGWALKELDA